MKYLLKTRLRAMKLLFLKVLYSIPEKTLPAHNYENV